jgi:hypothetical protein
MKFYQEILPFIDYLHSIRKLKEYLIFDIKFSSKWIIPKSLSDDSNLVPFETDNNELRGVSFVSSINEIDVDNTILKIEKIIKINKERELKERLFKEYVDKLKNTFENNTFDKLKNLSFEFEEETIKLENHESVDESENVELVKPREEERRSTGTDVQKSVDKRNNGIKKRTVISET